MKLNNRLINNLLNKKSVKNLLSFEKTHQVVIAVLLVLYLLLDVETPMYLANLVDTTLGNVTMDDKNNLLESIEVSKSSFNSWSKVSIINRMEKIINWNNWIKYNKVVKLIL